jgi:hypothetical protein
MLKVFEATINYESSKSSIDLFKYRLRKGKGLNKRRLLNDGIYE